MNYFLSMTISTNVRRVFGHAISLLARAKRQEMEAEFVDLAEDYNK